MNVKINRFLIIEREREREREQLKSYLQQNNIHSITLQSNGELLITYQNNQTKTMSANTQELKKIQSYLQSQSKQSLTQTELTQTTQSPKKSSLPWILGGVGIFALIVGLVWYFTRKENK